MNRLFFILSAIGILTCITINALALSGIHVFEGNSFMFILFLGAGIVFVPAIKELQKSSIPNQKLRGISGLRENQQKTKKLMKGIWSPFPLVLKVLFLLVVIYGFVNFFTMIFLLQEGQAEFENGKYFIENHGKYVRDITKPEYYQNKAYQSSLFTGHIAIFYSLSMMTHYSTVKK